MEMCVYAHACRWVDHYCDVQKVAFSILYRGHVRVSKQRETAYAPVQANQKIASLRKSNLTAQKYGRLALGFMGWIFWNCVF